jgi:CheY-like chemotaxis protein
MLQVMVIDDSAVARRMLCITMKSSGFEVVEASHGAEALALFAASDCIDAVICDLNMPIIDGFQFLVAFKAESKNANIPVLMHSVVGDRECIRRAMRVGAAAWLTKPIEPSRLLQTLTDALKKRTHTCVGSANTVSSST